MHQILRSGPLVAAVAASALIAPPAHAACYGPQITALVHTDGLVVVEGEGFGTDCHDAGPPPEGEGVLGPPARNIAVVVRQDGVEFLVAQGNAAEDYTFHVEVEPPPMVGEALVEARYPSQEGFTSYLTPDAAVTLPNRENLAGGTDVVTFGDEPGDLSEATANADSQDPAKTPAISPEPRESSGDLVAPGLALVGGVLLGALGTLWWSRRQSSSTRT